MSIHYFHFKKNSNLHGERANRLTSERVDTVSWLKSLRGGLEVKKWLPTHARKLINDIWTINRGRWVESNMCNGT